MIADFITLFRGRGDAYGSWSGGCIREPLTPQVFEEHLTTGPYIGVYPAFNHDGDTWCIWGCTDIDKTDDPSSAMLMHDTFMAAGVHSFVERTAHGWHVWVFAEELVLAQHMRRMFLAAHQVAQVPPTEVNPKQEQLLAGQLGNYVRLPYPGALRGVTDERRFIVDTGCHAVPIETFVPQALATRTSTTTIERLSAKYRAPQRVHVVSGGPSLAASEAAKELNRWGFVLWRDGPQGHRDRSSALMILVHRAAEAGLSAESAFELLKDADSRWGKFSMRGEAGLLELEKFVLQVYGRSPST